MENLWLNLGILYVAQFALFLFHTYVEKKISNILKLLLQGGVGGVVLCLPCDLIFGKYLGLGTYTLGFGLFFLLVLAFFLWGIYVAHILLMDNTSLAHFCAWLILVIFLSEALNPILHLWVYPFPVFSLGFLLIALISPLVLAMLIALTLHYVIHYRFAFIQNLFHVE